LRQGKAVFRNDVALAHALADLVDTISLRWFDERPAVQIKADGTPVSQADREVDEALVTLLRLERPLDEVLSEESGQVSPAGARSSSPTRRWILDPLDGNEAFLTGQRSWGTHVALEVAGELQVAVLTRPSEQLRWWAVRGAGAWCSPTSAPASTDRRLAVTSVANLTSARIGGFVESASPLAQVARNHAEWIEDPLGPIVGLLEGRVDAVLGPAGAVWDHAPQVLLTVEAGGQYMDRRGGRRLDASGGLYTNRALSSAITATPGLRHSDWPHS
jgi:histidinol-phosphatase